MYNPLDEVPEELKEMNHLESINLPLIRSGVIPEWFWERPALNRLLKFGSAGIDEAARV